MNSESKLQCYNRSCGQLFDPSQNTPESCLHHPGTPVFHDVYKKWPCCKKKTTDFTEFLNIKGCTRSYHSNVKPPEPPKCNTENKMEEAQTIPQPLEKKEVFVRPDANEKLMPIPFVIGSSLKPILEKMKKENTQNIVKVRDEAVQLDAPCQNKACKATYKGEESNRETCFYHSGVPVFHEGLKYWSCCVKRTTDFDSFLEQVGCTTGNHKWFKDDDENQLIAAKCRYDWHQTGDTVIISVFSKCPIPDLSRVEANQVKLNIHITFGEKRCIFDEEILLFGVINVSDCLVTYLPIKVEIKLKKSGFLQPWKYLAFKPEKEKSVCDVEKSMSEIEKSVSEIKTNGNEECNKK